MSNSPLNKIILIQVKLSSEGQRLDQYLCDCEELSSYKVTRSFLQDLIKKGHVKSNEHSLKASYKVKAQQLIKIEWPEKISSELIPYNIPLNIIYEDSDLIVVDKPAGLVVHPSHGHEQDTLVNALLAHTKELSMKNEERPGIVHRIDKETSGLLVVAKNDGAHEHLSAQFKNKTTHRIYYAIVEGQPPKKNGTVKSFLARHPTDRKRYASVRENNKIITQEIKNFEKGKWAVTHYEVLKTSKQMSLVKIKLETGRTHQIRIHFSELGHSLVGDTTYGFSVKKMKEMHLQRFYLHAAELGFLHPKTNEQLVFKCDWPLEDQAKITSWNLYDYFRT